MSSAQRNHIGPYRLLKLIRAGKATQVWEAMNPTDHTRVAIKALQNDRREDRGELALLKHEYNVGRNFNDPNVNRIHDFNIDRGLPYIVMDLCQGLNLKQSIRLSPELISEHLDKIVRQTASGLAHMHDQGWVHRDVKPDNYLIDEEGNCKLIDFAIAQKVKSGLGKLLSGRSKIQGTRSYMSPEQIRGGSIDIQSDIYSYGCTLFELVGGKLPYTGSTANELLNKHLKAPVPILSSVRDTVNSDFSDLIFQMMSKKPEQRQKSLHEFLDALEKVRILKRISPGH